MKKAKNKTYTETIISGNPHLENALDNPEGPLRGDKILCTVMVNVCISVGLAFGNDRG